MTSNSSQLYLSTYIYMYTVSESILYTISLDYWFSTGGDFVSLGDTEQYLETVLIVKGGRGCYWHLVAEVRDAAEHPTTPRRTRIPTLLHPQASTEQRITRCKMSAVLRLRNLALYTSVHLLLSTALRGKYYYHHFTDEGIEVPRG